MVGFHEVPGGYFRSTKHLPWCRQRKYPPGTERAVVMVTVSLVELERRAGTAYLDGIGYSSIRHLRRLCCDA